MFATYTESRRVPQQSSPSNSKLYSIHVEVSPQDDNECRHLLDILASLKGVLSEQTFYSKMDNCKTNGNCTFQVSNKNLKALRSLNFVLTQHGFRVSEPTDFTSESQDCRIFNNRYDFKGSEISIDEFSVVQESFPEKPTNLIYQTKMNHLSSTCSGFMPYGNFHQHENILQKYGPLHRNLTSFHNLRNEKSLCPTTFPTIKLDINMEEFISESYKNQRLTKQIEQNHLLENLQFRGLTFSPIREKKKTKSKVHPVVSNAPESGIQKKEKKPSTVVFVKGLTLKEASLEMIVNLFECFGTVMIAMFHKKREYTLIKYSSTLEAKTCIKELYGKEICAGRGHLLLHYSEYEDISPKYFSNEKVYYEPHIGQHWGLVPKKIGHLSRNVLISVNFYPGIVEQPHSSIIEAKLFKLFSYLPLKKTPTSSEFLAEFQGVKFAISFVMNNNYKEIIGGVAFITLTFAPRLTTSI